MGRCVFPVALAFAVGGFAIASRPCGADETLAEAAARERARREAKPAEEVPSYGDQDLERLRKSRPEDANAGGAEAPSGSDAGFSSDVPDPNDPNVVAGWQARAQVDRDAIAAIEARIAALEQRVGQLRAGGGLGRVSSPNRERSIQQDIASTLAEIERANGELEQARQHLDKTLEDARRAGITAYLLEQPPPPDYKGHRSEGGE